MLDAGVVPKVGIGTQKMKIHNPHAGRAEGLTDGRRPWEKSKKKERERENAINSGHLIP
jgi:hypothetical protein